MLLGLSRFICLFVHDERLGGRANGNSTPPGKGKKEEKAKAFSRTCCGCFFSPVERATSDGGQGILCCCRVRKDCRGRRLSVSVYPMSCSFFFSSFFVVERESTGEMGKSDARHKARQGAAVGTTVLTRVHCCLFTTDTSYTHVYLHEVSRYSVYLPTGRDGTGCLLKEG